MEIHSDNGSNFLGAKNDLRDLYQLLQSSAITSSISQYLLQHRVQWLCIPERAPHFGGLWEATVKSVKYHLCRVVGQQHLTYEEFATVTCQVEACVNLRPLTSITSHTIDGITPFTSLLDDHSRPILRSSSIGNPLTSNTGICAKLWSTIFGRNGLTNTYKDYNLCQNGNSVLQTYNLEILSSFEKTHNLPATGHSLEYCKHFQARMA